MRKKIVAAFLVAGISCDDSSWSGRTDSAW